MCILITFYKQKLNQQTCEFKAGLEALKKKQINTDPYPTIISKGRNTNLNKKYQIKYAKLADVSRAYAKWTAEEDNCLRDRYKRNSHLSVLAKKHKRTPRAIQMRLKVLKVY